MYFKVIIGVFFFIILISIQYSLNRIIYELKEIKKIIRTLKN